jgi:hypothetical protein
MGWIWTNCFVSWIYTNRRRVQIVLFRFQADQESGGIKR